MPLPQERRDQLNAIIEKMKGSNETDDSIREMVGQFKTKYDTGEAPKAAIPELIWQGVKNIPKSGIETGKGIAGMLLHPFRTAEAVGEYAGKVGNVGLNQLLNALGDPYVEPPEEAKEAVRSYTEPIRKIIEDPLGTPRRALEWASENPVPAGLMALGGIGTTGRALESIGVLPRVAKTLKSIESAPITLPIRAGEKIFKKPTVTEAVTEGMQKGSRYAFRGKGTPKMTERYLKNAEDAARDIVDSKENLQYSFPSGEVEKGRLPKSLNEFDKIISDKMVQTFQEYSDLTKTAQAKGGMIKPTGLVKELRALSNQATVQDLRPSLAKRASGLANNIEARIKNGGYSPGEIEREISALNNELDSFYATPGFKDEKMVRLKAMQANHFRKDLDNLVSSLTGKEYQSLKDRYGAYRGIQDDIHKKALVDARKADKGFFDLSNIFSAYHVLHGAATLNAPVMTAGMGARALSAFYKWRNSPNRAIETMFKKVEKGMAREGEKGPGYFNISEIQRRQGLTPFGEVPPSGLALEWNPRIPPVPGTPPTPNLPAIFQPPVAERGMVPTGEGFGVESVRRPQIEWWRGSGAKGVTGIPVPDRPLALPPGLGFTSREPGFIPRAENPYLKRVYGIEPEELGPGATTVTTPVRSPLPFLSRSEIPPTPGGATPPLGFVPRTSGAPTRPLVPPPLLGTGPRGTWEEPLRPGVEPIYPRIGAPVPALMEAPVQPKLFSGEKSSYKKVSKGKKDLVDIVKDMGGLSPTDPNIDAMALSSKESGMKGKAGLLRKGQTRTLDEMREDIIQESGLNPNITTDELSEMIQSHLETRKGIAEEARRYPWREQKPNFNKMKPEEIDDYFNSVFEAQTRIFEEDPGLLKAETINDLTDSIDNEIMHIREVEKSYGSKKADLDAEERAAIQAIESETHLTDAQIEKELSDFFSRPEPTAKVTPKPISVEAKAVETLPESAKIEPMTSKKGAGEIPTTETLKTPEGGVKTWQEAINDFPGPSESEPIHTIGYRYGDAPKSGFSYNTREGRNERGISLASAAGLPKRRSFATMSAEENRKIKYYEGDVIGYGGDDEPIMVNLKPITKKDYESKLKDQSNALLRIYGDKVRTTQQMYNSWSNPFPYTGINPYAEYLSEAQEKFKTKYNELSSIPNLASPAGEAGDVTSKALTKFAPSPTRKGETLLPGMKVGLEMKGGKEVTPTLEGTPLMEAAIKTEKEKVQPN